ncbi:diguanylate cyclase, partial [Streptomyces sp. SID7982]|nr:diguanylate cyclase [Streptomyces sp. SID7982]
MGASRSSGTTDELGPDEDSGGGPAGCSTDPRSRAGQGAIPGAPDGSRLLAALLDGMDAALCAFDAAGTVTHWNREAER